MPFFSVAGRKSNRDPCPCISPRLSNSKVTPRKQCVNSKVKVVADLQGLED